MWCRAKNSPRASRRPGWCRWRLWAQSGALPRSPCPASVPRVIADDADDDHVLACALAGNAELIVSGGKHLLRLGSEYQGIRIVTPAEAVSIVGAG